MGRELPLPGVAAIALYLLAISGVIIVGTVGRHYPPLTLILAALFMTASAGLVARFRWAWSMALAAVFLLACYYGWIFSTQRQSQWAVQGVLNLVFFLYLIRPEVRERLR
ncbi:hypothetical protein DYQ86_07645 [Acidobacteria bacterium AB60]|nr:hypothetical protein DYQ86_07645 [Acidobacteria bacterium AB60]